MLPMQILNISTLIPSEWFKPLKDFIISSNQGEGQSIRVNQKPRFERQKKKKEKSYLNVFFSFLPKLMKAIRNSVVMYLAMFLFRNISSISFFSCKINNTIYFFPLSLTEKQEAIA